MPSTAGQITSPGSRSIVLNPGDSWPEPRPRPVADRHVVGRRQGIEQVDLLDQQALDHRDPPQRGHRAGPLVFADAA